MINPPGPGLYTGSGRRVPPRIVRDVRGRRHGGRGRVGSGRRRTMASLHVLRGYVPGLRITLGRPETTLGRGTDCDVPIPITCVSRRHARISRRGDQFILWDLGSRNGTYLNHVLVRSLCPLRNGDHIRLADFEATFESAGALRQESDWQNSLDPHLMMGWLQGSATVSRRRLWLFVAACRRQFGGPGQWSAAELAERYAEEADRQE